MCFAIEHNRERCFVWCSVSGGARIIMACMRLVPMKEDIGRLGVEYVEQSRHAHDELMTVLRKLKCN